MSKIIGNTTATPKSRTLSYRGEWSSSESYSIDEIVTYNNALYVTIDTPTVGTTPDAESSAWDILANASSGSGDGASGEDGATFMPSVSDDGTLSWSNDKGLENPMSVNIKGLDGSDGENGATFTPFVADDGTLSWSNDKNLENPASVNIKGIQGEDGVGITSIEQTTTSTDDNGVNVITVATSDGNTSQFEVRNGSTGSAGANGNDGVSVSSITQTTTSNEDGGTNIITVTLSNGSTSTFEIKNGTQGSTGETGPAGSDASVSHTAVMNVLSTSEHNEESANAPNLPMVRNIVFYSGYTIDNLPTSIPDGVLILLEET